MRKLYILFFTLLITSVAFAQVDLPRINSITIDRPYHYNSTKNKINKTALCIDTVQYPQSKLTGLVEVDSMNVGYIEGVSQAYHFTGNGKIHGVNAYLLLDLDGIAGNVDSISMVISIYSTTDIDTSYPNQPISLVHTDTVDVFDVGFQEQTLLFDSLINVSDSFAIVLELNQTKLPPNVPWYGFTGYGDGNREKLAWAIFDGALYNTYTDWLGVGGWDVDMLLTPIIEQSITASYLTNKDSLCTLDSVMFSNQSVNDTDYMFNNFNTTSNYLYTWDFKDGTGVYHNTDTIYEFSNSGKYNVDLETIYYGYTKNCTDVASNTIYVIDTATSKFGFTHMGGGTYQFSDSSLAAKTTVYDFGDGITSSMRNPQHAFNGPGNYYVCLTVTDTMECNSNTFCDTISFVVGIDDIQQKQIVTIYPIPAKNFFNISVPTSYFGGEIIITDVVGKTNKKIKIEKQNTIKIATKEMSSGVYFVSIDSPQNKRVFTKRIMIDK